MTLRASRPGTLPTAHDARIGDVTLPAGVLAGPDPAFARPPQSGPVLWISRDRPPRVGALWSAVASGFAQHGLWPLILDSLGGADERPWLSGELDPAASSRPDGHDMRAVLEKHWSQVVPVEEEDAEALGPLAPFGRRFPGIAPASTGESDEAALFDAVGSLDGRLGLVAVARPADALATLGWSGPVNHYSDMGPLGAVLRSWEDRFEAYLVGVGFDTMTLAVLRPPRTFDHATAIAAEHFAMCSDNVYQGAGSIEEYASGLVDQTVWQFWWD